MTTRNHDYAAFRRKLTLPAAAHYERREAPDLAKTIGGIAESLEEFKRQQTAKLERLETRLSRPGASPAPADRSKTDGAPLIDTRTGKPVLEIRRGDDIEAMYRAHGLIGGGELGEDAPTLGDFMRAVAGQKASPLAQKALAVGTDAAGGHLVPSALMPTVLAALAANSTLMEAGSRLITMDDPGDGAKTFTFGAVNALPTAAWRSEGGAIAESDPTFRAIVATPRSLAFFFKVSRELLADGLNMDTTLAMVMGQSIAEALDRTALIGSGTAPEPRGVRNVAGIQTVTNGANGASLATTRWANLLSATQAILTANGGVPSAAIMAPRTLVGFGSLADTTNQPLQRPDLLRNVNMIATSQLPVNLTVGTSTDCTEIFVGDFRRTAWVLRESFSIQKLDQPFATTGQIGFVAHVRADFIAEYPATLALVTGVRP
jgi:HK97 family phage major capsid protein